MRPWPAIPDLPGHVVEVSRREDGARRRLDLFVHPDGLQPHHVAIRLDLWEGRDPALYAGFGAEARPVCLPEHLDPQERAVEAAAGLVAQVAEEAAARLRGLWAAARGRLEGRNAELEEAGELAQRIYLQRFTHRPCLLAGSTRSFAFPHLRFGLELCDGKVKAFWRPHWLLEPLTHDTLTALPRLSGHERLALLASANTSIATLRAAFLTALSSGAAIPDLTGIGSARLGCVGAYPMGRDGWIALRQDDWRSDPDPRRFCVEVFAPDGCVAEIITLPGSAPWAADGRIRIRIVTPDWAGFDVVLGGRRKGDGAPLPTVFHRARFTSSHKPRSVVDRAMRFAIEAILALDLDVAALARRHRPHPGDVEPRTHPLVAGIDIPDTQRHVVGQLLGLGFADYREASHRRFEKRAAKRRRNVA